MFHVSYYPIKLSSSQEVWTQNFCFYLGVFLFFILNMRMCWQWTTHPRIRICRPAQFSCGHASVHHGLCSKERTQGREWDSGYGLRKSYFEYHSTELNCIQAPVITWHYHQWTERRRILHSVSSISARLLLRQETRKAVALCWKECLRASVMLLNAELCIMFPLCEHKTTACASCLCVHACICRMCSHLWRNK